MKSREVGRPSHSDAPEVVKALENVLRELKSQVSESRDDDRYSEAVEGLDQDDSPLASRREIGRAHV